MNAKCVKENGHGVELRWSSGHETWPGYHETMRLSRGYWAGTYRQHSKLNSQNGIDAVVEFDAVYGG